MSPIQRYRLVPIILVLIFITELAIKASSISIGSSKKGTCIVAGATGYIGKAVVRESVRQGYRTVALVRDKTKCDVYENFFRGAVVVECDVQNVEELREVFGREGRVDSIISCLASPSGNKREAYAIDYQASLNCLEIGQEEDVKAKHFVLLSAFCVRRPLLQLQKAKLKFEKALTSQNDLTYSIVRPTAFFKSVSGQFESMKKGNSYVVFGDGAVTRCNPISEEDLAEFMVDCICDKSRHNQIINIGGPDEPLTAKQLGEMMQNSMGKEPTFVYAPTGIFDIIINLLQYLASATKMEFFDNAAETARIGKYYAVEDMLTTEQHEMYGKITMQMHYDKIIAEGQDPFTPVRATSAISQFFSLAPALGAALGLQIYLSLHQSTVLEPIYIAMQQESVVSLQ